MKKTMLALLSLLMILTLSACGNGGGKEIDKQAYYANFFDTHKVIEEPYVITTVDELYGSKLEYGVNGDLYYVLLSYGENVLTMYNTDNKAWVDVVMGGEDDGWMCAVIEDSEDVAIVGDEDMLYTVDSTKGVTYKETVKENGKEYDVLTATLKSADEEEEPFEAELWVCKDKVEKIVYDSVGYDEQDNEVATKTTMLISDGSKIALPAAAEKASEVDEDTLLWELIGFIFSDIDFDDFDIEE